MNTRYLLLVFFIIPLTYAQEIAFFKESYSPGETVQAELHFDISLIDYIQPYKLSLYNQQQEIVTQMNLLPIERNHYLLYFNIPSESTEGIYTLKISNVLYQEEILKTKSLEQVFTVISESYPRLQLLPGGLFYKPEEKNFKAVRISNKEETPVVFSLKEDLLFKPSINLIQLSAQSSKTFYVYIKPENIQSTGIYEYQLNEHYSIPAYLIKKEQDSPSCTPQWECSEWSLCVNNLQTRSCSDHNNCNLPCTEECFMEKICVAETENITSNQQGNIIFFIDKNNPEATVNSLTNPNIPEHIELKGPLYIQNKGSYSLTNITFFLTGNIPEIMRINITEQASFLPGEILVQYIWVNEKNSPIRDEYEGDLIFKSNELQEAFPIYFSIARKEEAQSENLFIENKEIPLPEEQKIGKEIKKPEQKKPEVTIPYKLIASMLSITLIILLYFFVKKPKEKKTSFQEYISKLKK